MKTATVVGRVYAVDGLRCAISDAEDGAVELVWSSPNGVSRSWLPAAFLTPIYRELAARVEGAAIADNVVPFREPKSS